MKVQLLSDLHVEFRRYPYPETDADVVVLAGDIHIKSNGFHWATEYIKNKPVIYVLGNHEFYGKAYPKHIEEIKSLTEHSNVHILENDVVTIDGVNFLGCTLWTDFELFGDPKVAGHHCQQIMTDYRKIRRTPMYSKMRSIDTAVIHRKSTNWLAKELEARKDQKNIVVTHHAPSIRSAPEHKHEALTTAAYASNLEGFIETHQPDFWLHGHLHHSSDYRVGNCRILCNPKGYPGQENESYNPEFCFEI